ncbi:hypothetical protein DFJ73DRAFT_953762 [Zopfochytrium polystomum]|nr:hypothetical protein DFJ73DRAFT_953762 [Zopfochytrium polystomum]
MVAGAAFAAAAVLALVAVPDAVAAGGNGPHTYCRPTQSCWPGSIAWSAFNRTVGGRLIQVVPLAKPCYDDPSGEACQSVQAGYYDPAFRSKTPGASEYLNWETCGSQNCQIDLVAPSSGAPLGNCSLGRLSVYAVNVSSTLDVTAAIFFARLFNIKIAIKNTGHDLSGRSHAPDSLTIWTHNLKEMKYEPNFTVGQTSSPAFRFGAGIQTFEATAFANANNKSIVQGDCPTVGIAGGWWAGGGKGPFGPIYGLGAENVLEVTIVTADGLARTLNDASTGSEADLFWAVRGGGGGTWGVVTEVVFKAHPIQPFVLALFSATLTNHSDPIANTIMKEFLTVVAQNQPKVTALSAFGTYTFSPYSIGGRYLFPGSDVGLATKTAQPIMDIIAKYNTSFAASSVNINAYPSFVAASANIPDGNPYGFNALVSTRLVPKSLFANDSSIATLVDAIIKGYYLNNPPDSPQAGIDLIASIAVTIDASGPTDVKNRPATAVHPAWSDSYWHVIYATGWTKNLADLGLVPLLEASISSAAEPLRAITPGGGTYLNEADPNEADWQGAFFGSNYPRLLEIKNKWDPNGVFTVWKGVGWVEKQDSSEYCYYEQWV